MYNDENPFEEPDRKTMLVPWNLTLRGHNHTEAMETMIGFSQVIARTLAASS